MEYIQDITLDLDPNVAPLVISAKQSDVDSRIIRIHYTKNGQPYEINQNSSVAFRMRKPDMHLVLDDGVINSDGTVSITLTYQCLSAAGRAYADVVEFNSKGQMLSTVAFILDIQASPDVMGHAALSSDEFLYLKSFIDSGNQIIGKAQEWANGYNGDEPVDSDSPAYNNHAKYWSEQASAQVILAAQNGEAWAEGTRGGSPVPSTDPAYNHNSKYWAGKASENGEAWAEGTRNGQSVPSTDPTYNHNSKYWANQSSRNGEAWSIGTRDGQAIPSSDPAYNNYSKYWALRTKACIDTIHMSYDFTTGVLSMTIDDL